MKRGSTMILRAAVMGNGLLVIGLCILILPVIAREWAGEYPEIAYMRYPVIAGLCATVVPFFISLYQAMRLLGYIDRNTAFSVMSVRALRSITLCATAIGVLYAGALPLVYYMTEVQDAPGLMLIGLIITLAAFVMATFAAVLQQLLGSAIEIKSENDLTV